MPEQPSQPQLIDEVEAVIGIPFFDDPRADVLYYEGVQFLDQAEVGGRWPIYIAGLRILAEARRIEREATNQNMLGGAWEETLTATKIKSIQFQFMEEIGQLAARLAAIKSSENQKRVVAAELKDNLRDHQHPYMDDIIAFMESEPQDIAIQLGDALWRNYSIKGAVVEAPTGSGKTPLIARTAVAAKIGQPRADGPPRKMLLVVPSVDLTDQFTGKLGDDTLRRFAPGLTVGAFCGGEKNTDANIVAITIEQFVDKFRHGKLKGVQFDLLAIDEGHHLTEPRFLEVFLNHWQGPAIAFTATSAYNPDKDVKKILPYVIKHGDTVSYMLEGIINGAQLFMAVVDPKYDKALLGDLEENTDLTENQFAKARQMEHESIIQASIDFMTPLLAQGRRGIVFCGPGKNSFYARDLAARLRNVTLPDDRRVKAKAAHSFSFAEDPDKNAIEDYVEGKIDVLTSVGKAQEGLNAEVDFVVIAYDTQSDLKLAQIIGRGTRISKKFPLTVYAQFVLPLWRRSGRPKTIYECLGFDVVEQGQIITRETASGRSSRVRRDRDSVSIEAFSPSMRSQLEEVQHRLASEVIVRPRNVAEVPGDYIPFTVIYEPVKHIINEKSAKQRLDVAGYSWSGVPRLTPEGYRLERHYEPSAGTFFTDNPLPPRASPEHSNYTMLSNRLGVSDAFLRGLVSRIIQEGESNMEQVQRLDSRGISSGFFEPEDVRLIEQRVHAVPTANPDDVSVEPFAKSLKVSADVVKGCMADFTPPIQSVYKRRAEGKGFAWFITAEEKLTIKNKIEECPWASPDEWSLPRMIQESGLAKALFTSRFKPSDEALGFLRRTKTAQGYVRRLRHWRKSDALVIIERIKNFSDQLPLHLLPYAAVRKIVRVPGRLPDSVNSDSTIKLQLPGSRKSICLPWETIRVLQTRYGFVQGVSIDFDRLPTGPNDDDPDRNAYARSIQQMFYK